MDVTSNVKENPNLTLDSLLWDDILFPHVFSYLSLKDLFNLRSVSIECKRIVECYFTQMKKCDINKCSHYFPPYAYLVLIEHCRQLKYLLLKNSQWVTNVLLKHLVLNNISITHIDLSGCLNMNSAALQPVLLHLKDLVSIKLGNCLWLTTGCIEALALHHSKLETISLQNCSIIDVKSICILLKKSANLIELNLSGIPAICDDVMEVIAHCNTKLSHLNVNFCPRVSNYGIMMVSEYCRQLKHLHIKGCSISFQTILELKKKIIDVQYAQQNVQIENNNILGWPLNYHLQV